MSAALTIEISDELLQHLRQSAARQGKTAEIVAAEYLASLTSDPGAGARQMRHEAAPVDVGVRGEPEDVGMQVFRSGQLHRLRRRSEEDDLVLLGDGRHRRRLGRGQRAGQEIDIVLDDQLTREPHRLVGIGLAIACEELELLAENATLGVDLIDRHLGAFEDRIAINRGRSG